MNAIRRSELVQRRQTTSRNLSLNHYYLAVVLQAFRCLRWMILILARCRDAVETFSRRSGATEIRSVQILQTLSRRSAMIGHRCGMTPTDDQITRSIHFLMRAPILAQIQRYQPEMVQQ